MAEQIRDGRGNPDQAGVTSGNRVMVDSVINETIPIDGTKNNPAWKFSYMLSGTSTGITSGSYIGSIVQYVGVGSYVQTITYFKNNITNIGSWA